MIKNKEELIGTEWKCLMCDEKIVVTVDGIDHHCKTHQYMEKRDLQYLFSCEKFKQERDNMFMYGDKNGPPSWFDPEIKERLLEQKKKLIADGRGLMAHIKEIKPATEEEFGDWLKNALKSISEQPIEPRQQMLNAWLLIAYPDDMFLSVFKSKKDDGIVYIGGSEVMHQIHKRLYELDQKLYIELFGPEAGEKLGFDEMSNLFVSEPKKDEVDMEPYNALTKAKLEKILKPIFKHKSKK